jgi:DUF4097 and DUF4098 domain-containing protein YvlB
LQARAVNGQLYFPQPVSVRLELPRATRMLALWSTGGAIDASGLEGSVQATTAAGQITLDRIGGDVEIHSGGGPTSLGTIGGHVRCFSGGGPIRGVLIRGTAVFESDGGDIYLGQVVGTVRAITAAGGIRIEQAGGDVYADTFGGPISIPQAAGLVVATTSGGPIDITGASSVQCQTASGAIHLNNVSGHLRAVTERGSIVAGIRGGHRLEDSFLSTRSGDITVFLPSDTNVTIQAETSGSHNRRAIASDFPGLDVVKRPSVSSAEGKINEGGPLLRLTGMGGRIEIKRK